MINETPPDKDHHYIGFYHEWYIKKCSNSYAFSPSLQQVFSDGNQRKDEDDYYKAQQIWIKNNPERFKKIKNNSLY